MATIRYRFFHRWQLAWCDGPPELDADPGVGVADDAEGDQVLEAHTARTQSHAGVRSL